MSTILKALEKDNNAPQTFVIEKRSASNGKFLLVLGSVTIILLLTVIALLLFKPRILSQIKPVTQPALVTNIVEPVSMPSRLARAHIAPVVICGMMETSFCSVEYFCKI